MYEQNFITDAISTYYQDFQKEESQDNYQRSKKKKNNNSQTNTTIRVRLNLFLDKSSEPSLLLSFNHSSTLTSLLATALAVIGTI